MATFTHQPDIKLESHRCYGCGRYYAVEASPSSCCPYCASRDIDSKIEELATMERRVRSLRGAITRLRRRK